MTTTRTDTINGTGKGGALIVASLIPALFCYLAFAVWLPSDVGRHRDYGAAEQCPDRAATQRAEDCLRTVTFTVKDTEIDSRGKRVSYTAILYAAPFWNHEVAFGDPGPVLERLRPGERITGTVWRGDIMTITKGDARQNTADAPRDEAQMTAAIGTFAGLLAAVALGFGAVRLTRPRDPEPFTWRPYGKWLLITLGVLCAGAGFLSLWLGLPWWLVPTVVIPVMSYVAWQLYRHCLQRLSVAPAP
ncbi:hypothetical protein OHA71_28390 [Streptomyces sp. NBC_00444]|uniref:hypothetical protein n=1 Tax=Streptomyces sp. NBC_00444 TaxID=2975744 RepID=UPI002E226CE7